MNIGFTAEEVVGWNFPVDNTSLKASSLDESHIAPLRAFGPAGDPLAACLDAPSIRREFGRYVEWNHDAIASRGRYEWQMLLLTLPTVSALALTLSLLIPPQLIVGPLRTVFGLTASQMVNWDMWLRQTLPWLIYLLLLSPLLVAALTRPNRTYARRQESRANAEGVRRRIFRAVLHSQPTDVPPSDPWLLQLKLEYFRRWQVEVQYAFFRNRRRELNHLLWRSRLAICAYVGFLALFGLVLVAAGLGGWDENGITPLSGRWSGLLSYLAWVEVSSLDAWLLLALSATIVVGLYLFSRASIADSRRNAARYRTMEENFTYIRGEKLQAARRAAEDGDEHEVHVYFDMVDSMLSVEANDWVRLGALDAGIEPGLNSPRNAANSIQ